LTEILRLWVHRRDVIIVNVIITIIVRIIINPNNQPSMLRLLLLNGWCKMIDYHCHETRRPPLD